MEIKDTMARAREELEGMRTRFDELRVQANLGRKELRDELDRLGEKLGPAHRKAKQVFEEALRSGAEEVRTLGSSLQAGWGELVRTHEELSRELEAERDAKERERRS